MRDVDLPHLLTGVPADRLAGVRDWVEAVVPGMPEDGELTGWDMYREHPPGRALRVVTGVTADGHRHVLVCPLKR